MMMTSGIAAQARQALGTLGRSAKSLLIMKSRRDNQKHDEKNRNQLKSKRPISSSKASLKSRDNTRGESRSSISFSYLTSPGREQALSVDDQEEQGEEDEEFGGPVFEVDEDTVLDTEEKHDQRKIVRAIAAYVDTLKSTPPPTTIISNSTFYSNTKSKTSLLEWIETLVVSANVWVEDQTGLQSIGVRGALAATALLERLPRRSSVLFASTIHMYFLAAFIISIKLIDDNNSMSSSNYWALCAQLNRDHVNSLEIQLLKDVDWRVNVDSESFSELLDRLIQLS